MHSSRYFYCIQRVPTDLLEIIPETNSLLFLDKIRFF
jgi:hypothetical protein